MTGVLLVLTTIPADQATTLARQVVGERLAACAQIQAVADSIYWWQGAIQTDREATIVLKTSDTVIEPLITRIKALHPYELPEILVFEAIGGLHAYLDWVHSQTFFEACNP